MNYTILKNKVLQLNSEQEFNDLALELFKYQYKYCTVYRDFCNYLKVNVKEIHKPTDIPFLPIEFFKSHKVISSTNSVQTVFTSSGTTGMQTSRHYIIDTALYEQNFRQIFQNYYGDINGYAILALLPSYLEREGSSLIYMVNDLITQSGNSESGFYLHNINDLHQKLIELESKQQKTILIGVSFALLDFVETYKMDLNHTIVMETGGMKGRKKEMIREELHALLKEGFGIDNIHSEYGMTELLSQAYSVGNGVFTLPKTMNIYIRDVEDPLSYLSHHKTGGINVIDLANINSCAFIATKDLGRYVNKKEIEILGRFDNSDVRGCNLLTL